MFSLIRLNVHLLFSTHNITKHLKYLEYCKIFANIIMQVCFPWLDPMFIYYSPLTRETFLVILPPWCTRPDQNICSTTKVRNCWQFHRRFQIKSPFSFCLLLWKLWIPLDCVFIFASRAGKLLLCPELQCAKTSFQMEFLEI